ncbi:MAG TPA: hypothetical protein VFD92_07205 [Candidatus Binatia bacterium]|jgi:hypothetical protein|nr:hypothetical protein [Candidatus Binatia bacterium]
MARRVPVIHPLWSWVQLRYSVLLVTQLTVFLVYPFCLDTPVGVGVMLGFITVTLITAALSLDPQHRGRAYILAAPTLGFLFAAIATMSDSALLIACVAGSLCVAYEIASIFGNALRIERVSIEKVQGSLAVFLLLGLNFALVYSILELLRSGSFALGDPPQHIPIHVIETGMSTHMLGFSHLLFHSYMTLCATSYGTVAAITPPALALTALETLIGQLYIAILVAQLMGLHLAFSASSRSR